MRCFDRARLAKLAAWRGHVIDADITKIYKTNRGLYEKPFRVQSLLVRRRITRRVLLPHNVSRPQQLRHSCQKCRVRKTALHRMVRQHPTLGETQVANHTSRHPAAAPPRAPCGEAQASLFEST